MKKLTIATLIISVCLSSNVMAKKNSHYDYARVVRTSPVYEYVEHQIPIQTCHNIDHRHHAPKHKSVVPTVVGGIIGGTVGHTIGSNRSNKQVGLIAGTVVGAVIGSEIGADRHHRREPSRHCSTSYQVERERILTGYDVCLQISRP